MSPTETFDILMYYIMHYINSMHTYQNQIRLLQTRLPSQWSRCSRIHVQPCKSVIVFEVLQACSLPTYTTEIWVSREVEEQWNLWVWVHVIGNELVAKWWVHVFWLMVGIVCGGYEICILGLTSMSLHLLCVGAEHWAIRKWVQFNWGGRDKEIQEESQQRETEEEREALTIKKISKNFRCWRKGAGSGISDRELWDEWEWGQGGRIRREKQEKENEEEVCKCQLTGKRIS